MTRFAATLCFCLLASLLHAEKPNIVMIISDDQAWTDYGFMGHKQVATPNIDRLAKESLTYRRGYVPSSLCCPSLASIVTGLYPHQHKITSNDPPIPKGMKAKDFNRSEAFKKGRDKMIEFAEAAPCLPRMLAQNGYNTFQTGKWWLGEFKHGGFTHGMTKGGRHGDEGLAIGRKSMQPIYDFIAESGKEKKPFFVWYAPMMPHDPHTPPKELLDKYLKVQPNIHIAKYWAMCEWFDQTIGDLLKHLEEQGLAKNTIITYVSDNGWIQDPNSERFAPKSKLSQYDGGLRSPIMVRWPGTVAPKMSDTPVSSIDLFPTLLKLAGIEGPKTSGVDLCDESAVNGRKAIFGECFSHNFVDMDKPASSLYWRWMVEGNLKLIVPNAVNQPTAAVELYDVTKDAMEESNLAASREGDVKSMTAKMEGWWKP